MGKEFDGQTEEVSKLSILELLTKIQAINYGAFVTESGEQTNIYFDLRRLTWTPDILLEIARRMAKETENIDYDFIAGIPIGGMPLATALSLTTKKPMIFIRNSAKEYGTKKTIEGTDESNINGLKALLVDDVITVGQSKARAIEALTTVNVTLAGIAVVVDRRTNEGEPFLETPVYSLVRLSQIS